MLLKFNARTSSIHQNFLTLLQIKFSLIASIHYVFALGIVRLVHAVMEIGVTGNASDTGTNDEKSKLKTISYLKKKESVKIEISIK